MPASLSLLCRLPLCVGLAVASLHGRDGYDSGGSPLQLVKRLGLEQETPPERIGTWLRIRGMAKAPVWPAAGGPESQRAGGQRDTGGDVAPSSALRSSGALASAALNAEVARVREALAELRAAGYRSACVLWGWGDWRSGFRPVAGAGRRSPLDLREAYERAYALAATYGDLVDAWEFENEPDIAYLADNADVFTAYYKAVALGIAQGRERAWARVGEKNEGAVGEKKDRAVDEKTDRATEDRATEGGTVRTGGERTDRTTEDRMTERQSDRATEDRIPEDRMTADRTTEAARRRGERSDRSTEAGVTPSADLMICRSVNPPLCRSIRLAAASRIVMPALALPPGPYLEQLLANGFLHYTEGANLHYYGFAEDYADAHARLREALGGAVATPVPGVGLGRIGKTPDTGVATRGARTAGSENARDGRDDTNPRSGVATPVPGVGLGAEGAPFRYAPRFFKVRPPSLGFSPSPSSGRRPSVPPGLRASSAAASPRRLPVFVTEWGYPRLDGYAAQTVEGRVRQWRFFQEVQATNERLRVAAPMAFYLLPYFEYAAKEFGLSMPPAARRAAHYGFAVEAEDGGRKTEDGGPVAEGGEVERVVPNALDRRDSPTGTGEVERVVPNALDRRDSPTGTHALGATRSTFKAGGLNFTPADFSAEAVEPWMRRIGERIGDAEASPALAWLWEPRWRRDLRQGGGRAELLAPRATRHFRSPSLRPPSAGSPASGSPAVGAADWLVHAEAPSPVVVDFVAGEGTLAVKNTNGYWLSGGAEAGGPEAGAEAGKPEAGGPVAGGVATPVSGVRIGADGKTPDTGVATQGAKVGRGVLVFYNFGPEPAELSWDWPDGIEPEAGRSEAGGPEGRTVGGPDEGRLEGGDCQRRMPAAPSSVLPSSVLRPPASGRRLLAADSPASGSPALRFAERLTLAPGERREIAVRLSVPDAQFAPAERRLALAVCSGGATTVSRWATRVYPMPAGYLPAEERGFDFAPEAAAKNRAWLLARPHAAEEPRLLPQGAWLTTPGVRVEETATGWRFHVEALPDLTLCPAVVELPLPDDWAPWETGLMLSYDYRIAPASFALRTPLRADDPDVTRRRQTGKIGDLIETYLRTETGNLYSTQPRLLPTPEWKRYNQTAETLTPHFPGRLAAPLRVSEERPASLVFFLRPAGLPTVFEIGKPRLAHWRLPD